MAQYNQILLIAILGIIAILSMSGLAYLFLKMIINTPKNKNHKERD